MHEAEWPWHESVVLDSAWDRVTVMNLDTPSGSCTCYTVSQSSTRLLPVWTNEAEIPPSLPLEGCHHVCCALTPLPPISLPPLPSYLLPTHLGAPLLQLLDQGCHHVLRVGDGHAEPGDDDHALGVGEQSSGAWGAGREGGRGGSRRWEESM